MFTSSTTSSISCPFFTFKYCPIFLPSYPPLSSLPLLPSLPCPVPSPLLFHQWSLACKQRYEGHLSSGKTFLQDFSLLILPLALPIFQQSLSFSLSFSISLSIYLSFLLLSNCITKAVQTRFLRNPTFFPKYVISS